MMKRKAIDESRERFLSGIGVPPKTAFVADEFQQTAIDNLAAGIDTLVVAPTGSGKTFIAIQAMKNLFAKGQSAIYTTPLKALSNTKYSEFQQIFGPDHSVGLLTGDRKIEGDSDVVIATTEIYRNELYRGYGRYSLVILDEVHYIADPQRGAVWEESIILTPSSATLLMLSASISNAEEIASWIEETRNKECRIVQKTERPVELRYGFLHPKWGVIPLSDEKRHLSPEVAHYYSGVELDMTGTRIALPRGRGPSGRGEHERSDRGRRSRGGQQGSRGRRK